MTVVSGSVGGLVVWLLITFTDHTLVPAHRFEAAAENVGVSMPSLLNISRSTTTILLGFGVFWLSVLTRRAKGKPTNMSRQWWCDVLNIGVDGVCGKQHGRVVEIVYGKSVRLATIFVACLLIFAMHAVCIFVFVLPYTIDSPFGADPVSDGGTTESTALAAQVAGIFGGN
jgi:hypothetical protein